MMAERYRGGGEWGNRSKIARRQRREEEKRTLEAGTRKGLLFFVKAPEIFLNTSIELDRVVKIGPLVLGSGPN